MTRPEVKAAYDISKSQGLLHHPSRPLNEFYRDGESYYIIGETMFFSGKKKG